MIYRIGDRDPVTGLYDVIWPDGSFTRNGVKIFNSAHEFGDVVLATQRSDGMMILDGVKATVTEVVNTSFTLGGFGEKPVGYLNGQVFNNEDEVILPIVSVKFAPGIPEELAPGAGDFVVRIKIDRPQRKDLRVRLEFTGTAIAADYTTVGLAADSPTVPIVIIPAGGNFADITITPASSVDSAKTIIVTAMQLREYRIGQDKSVTATILAKPIASVSFAPGSPTSLAVGAGSFVMRVSIDNVQTTTTTVLGVFTGTAISGDYTVAGVPIVIAAGNSFADVTITPTATQSTNKTIVLTLSADASYTIGSSNSATATITALGVPTVTVVQLCPPTIDWGGVNQIVLHQLFYLERTNSILLERLEYEIYPNLIWRANGDIMTSPSDRFAFPGEYLISIIEAGATTSEIGYARLILESDNPGWVDLGFAPFDLGFQSLNSGNTEQHEFINNFSTLFHDQYYIFV